LDGVAEADDFDQRRASMNREKRAAAAEDSFAEAARETMDHVREAAGSAYGYGRRNVERGIEGTQRYVTERPFQSLVIAAGAGLVLGYLLRGRR
jgi:ElaB/YqjD/DUF883 family membrane-anchored ribosome-binding protein